MSEDMFEEVTATKYKLDIIERTEEEARRGMLEGEEFMVIEIQVIGMVENYQGKDSLAIDYIAAFHQKALTSRWMEEKIRLLSDSLRGDRHGHKQSDKHPALPPNPETGGSGTVPVPVVCMVVDGR